MKKLLLIILVSFILVATSVLATNISVPVNYTTIQEAINAASSGDTINVAAGNYSETLIINKSNLIIQGSGAATTIIDLNQPSETTGIWITANNTVFDGFTVMNVSTTSGTAQYAIRVRGINNTISNNIIIGQSSRDWWNDEEDSGINLDGTSSTNTSNNIVENNEIYNFSAMGVQVVGSGGSYNAYDNIIRDNNIHNIQYYAIANDRSANQTITNNTLTNIGPSGHVADGYPAIGIIVFGINSNGTKIIFQNLSGMEIGVALSAAQNITINDSEIKNNSIGIRLANSSWLAGQTKDNQIINNTISNNDYGILVRSGVGNNEINYNSIYGNSVGVNSSTDFEINAEYNWWGNASGPGGNGPGTGDNVSINVDYSPWLGSTVGTTPMIWYTNDNIQDAIDAASDGDMILVSDGIYGENLVINKTLTLQNTSKPVINGNGTTAVNITEHGVVLNGFEIMNATNVSHYGIVMNSTNNTIINNDIHDNWVGVRVIGSGSGTVINDNNIYNNREFGALKDIAPVVDATLNWWGSCDGPGGNGTGSGNNVSDNITYIPFLGSCFGAKNRTPSCIFYTDNVTLYINLTSGCVQNVTFEINIGGIWQNYSGTKLTDGTANYSYKIDSTMLNASEFVNWTVYVTDCYNFTDQDGNRSFYVNNRTNMSVSPVSPDGLNGWYVTEPLYTLTNTDAFGFWYRWDGTRPINYTGPFGLENISNPPKPDSAGTLDLTYWSEVACGNESQHTETFYVDLTSPGFKNHKPANFSNITNTKPEISVYVEEKYGSNSGINTSTVSMLVDGVNVTPDLTINLTGIGLLDNLDAIVSYTPAIDLSTGWHDVEVYAGDHAGWTNWTNWTFEIISFTIFDMIVNSPIDRTYYDDRRVSLDINLTDEVEVLEYINWNDRRPRWRRLCRGCTYYNRTKSFRDGKFNETLGYADSWYNITIKANDSYGNTKGKNISFFIDSKKPRITRTLPRRGRFTNGSDFYIKYTEDNMQEINITYGNDAVGYREETLVGCEAGRNKECNISPDLSSYDNQVIEYWFNITDFVRRAGSRNVTNVYVDTTDPTMDLNYNISGRYVTFDVQVTEDNLDRVSYYDNNALRPAWRTLCTRLVNNRCIKKRYFSVGNHNIDVRVTDKAENFVKENIVFTV